MKENVNRLYQQTLIREKFVDMNGNPSIRIIQNPQEFADSIIRECIELVDNHFESKNHGYPGDVIKQHFGIE